MNWWRKLANLLECSQRSDAFLFIPYAWFRLAFTSQRRPKMPIKPEKHAFLMFWPNESPTPHKNMTHLLHLSSVLLTWNSYTYTRLLQMAFPIWNQSCNKLGQRSPSSRVGSFVKKIRIECWENARPRRKEIEFSRHHKNCWFMRIKRRPGC